MTGDQQDMLSRLKAAMPYRRWFGDSNPVVDALLSGFAYALALGYSLLAYTKLQTRLATATDGFLDLISYDFFGSTLMRRFNEQDTPFRARIQANLLVPKGTRPGMIQTLLNLTGRAPIIFEPARPADTGAYNRGATLAYNAAGGYGSLRLPYQCFITAYRPASSGIPNVAGYGVATGAYSTGSQIEYASLSMVTGAVTDADIYLAIDGAKAAATIAWTRLSN